MAMTGLQIQKLLPKTNCKECGSGTCMAFAMKLAAKKAELSDCPYASDEAKRVLGADAEPPMKSFTLADKTVGGETVLYRHEKTFVHETLLAIDVRDTEEKPGELLRAIEDYKVERVGEELRPDALSLSQTKEDARDFVKLTELAMELCRKPLLLRALDTDALRQALAVIQEKGGRRCLLYGATAENLADYRSLAMEGGHALALCAPDMDSLLRLCEDCRQQGFADFIPEWPAHSLAEVYQLNSIARRRALKENHKALGYPSVRYIHTGSLCTDTVHALTEINKYGGICVLPSFEPAQLVTLLALRQNIYTDPQKPIQVEPKVYPVGEPNRESPVFVTTNFSLTYFLVSGEIENAGINAWLLIPECEGMSVLTAWAAGKFSGAHIAKALHEFGLEDMTNCRRIIIPGYVSGISGELEEALPGWTVTVGPQEAGDIESFAKLL